MTYKENDDGRQGKSYEVAYKCEWRKIRNLEIREKDMRVSPAGKSDAWIFGKNVEFKTGAGELGFAGEKLVKGSSTVVFCPVVKLDEAGNADVYNSEAFVLTRELFLNMLSELGLLRTKPARNGSGKIKMTIQTYWKVAEGVPHGSKYYRMVDMLREFATTGKAINAVDALQLDKMPW